MNVGDKFRIFCVCMSAAKITDPVGDEGGQISWMHDPGVISAVDVETVAAQAGIAAFDKWPVDDGWSEHSASIVEITAELIQEVWTLHQQAMLADEPLPEPQYFVQFEPPATTAH